MSLEFRILGPIEVLDGVQRVPIAGPTQVRLLAYLILNAGSPVPAERLADEVWGDADPGRRSGSSSQFTGCASRSGTT